VPEPATTPFAGVKPALPSMKVGARVVRPSGAAELGLTDRSDIARAISEATVDIDSRALLKPPVLIFMLPYLQEKLALLI